jgi:hypothetical protein
MVQCHGSLQECQRQVINRAVLGVDNHGSRFQGSHRGRQVIIVGAGVTLVGFIALLIYAGTPVTVGFSIGIFL